MESSPPGQTNNSRVGQEFLLVLQNSMVHKRARKDPQAVLSHIIRVHNHLSIYVRSFNRLQRSIFNQNGESII